MRQEQDEEIIHDQGESVEESEKIRPELHLSRQERRWVALGALKSALLIALVYLAGLAFVIWLMLTMWT